MPTILWHDHVPSLAHIGHDIPDNVTLVTLFTEKHACFHSDMSQPAVELCTLALAFAATMFLQRQAMACWRPFSRLQQTWLASQSLPQTSQQHVEETPPLPVLAARQALQLLQALKHWQYSDHQWQQPRAPSWSQNMDTWAFRKLQHRAAPPAA